jgi:hypothetical protein
MIQLKPRPPIFATLKSKEVKEVKRQIAEKVKRNNAINSKDFPSDWRNDDVKKTLWEHHNHN